MGEDFVRKRNEHFIRYRAKAYDEIVRPDLFSTVPPERRVVLVGAALSPSLSVGQVLLAEACAGEPIEFLCGAEPVVRTLDAGPFKRLTGPLYAKVLEVFPEETATVEVISWEDIDGRSARDD